MTQIVDKHGIDCVAREMARVHKRSAVAEAKARAAQAYLLGDEDGGRSWLLVMRAIQSLSQEPTVKS